MADNTNISDWLANLLGGGVDPLTTTNSSPADDPAAAANFGDSVTSGKFMSPPMTPMPAQNMSPMPPSSSDDSQLQDVPSAGQIGAPYNPSAPSQHGVNPIVAAAVQRSISNRDGLPPDLNSDALANQQQLASKLLLASRLGQAAQTFGSAMAHAPQADDKTFFDQAQKDSQAPVTNLLARRKAYMDDIANRNAIAEQDPGSELSQNMRAAYAPMLTKLGLSDDALQNASAADLKGFFQQPLETMTKLKSAADAKQVQLAQIQANKEAALGEKTDKRFTTLGEALDENKGRTGEFGRQAQIINNADKALVLGKQFADGNLPPAQMAELAGATANLVSGGNGAAEATVHRFVPQTFSGSEAGIAQWLSSEPKGAGQQAFVKQLLETAQREKDLANSKVNAIKLSRVADYKDLATKDPQRFDIALQSHGINPKDYAEFAGNNYQVPQRISNPLGNGQQDPKISQWASQHQLPYEQAASILKARGYGG